MFFLFSANCFIFSIYYIIYICVYVCIEKYVIINDFKNNENLDILLYF